MEHLDPDILVMKEELIDHVKTLVGHEPPGIRALLRVLAHPSIIQETNRYFSNLDTSTKCLRYEAPWTCAKEAEANYENIKFGWLGGAGGIGFDESWCPNCRKRVLGGEG